VTKRKRPSEEEFWFLDDARARREVEKAMRSLGSTAGEEETFRIDRYVALGNQYHHNATIGLQTPREIQKKLREIRTQAETLANKIGGSFDPAGFCWAIEAMEGELAKSVNNPFPLEEFEGSLRRLADAAASASVPLSAKRNKGPAPRARAIAHAAAQDYFELKGPPGRGYKSREADDGFEKLLSRLFAALGVEEEADSYAQAAVKRWSERNRVKRQRQKMT
jgi:hypothetical protein